jgi:hypothetical protein
VTQLLERLKLGRWIFAQHETSRRRFHGPRPPKRHLFTFRTLGHPHRALHTKTWTEGHSHLRHHATAERWIEHLCHKKGGAMPDVANEVLFAAISPKVDMAFDDAAIYHFDHRRTEDIAYHIRRRDKPLRVSIAVYVVRSGQQAHPMPRVHF